MIAKTKGMVSNRKATRNKAEIFSGDFIRRTEKQMSALALGLTNFTLMHTVKVT